MIRWKHGKRSSHTVRLPSAITALCGVNLPQDAFWLLNGQGSSHQSHENHVCYDNLLVFPNQNAKNACAAPHKNDMKIGPA
ncbi:hypothetical protein N7491_009099 [Penicillium cf. griseofulvum]|uniref:Uncharacterized protein n=1 Tax=Penicillium cf. griseofulvum TaxID=2972120 RepID=A0A9W9JU75_9EURO|nr:hypothetical protein N7472_005305 [Penicillium cf. griseofulvum]KAJ5423883.1 hypothetical protein N7491_009099 [Penicillium cf. griseofulvum]KAJ5430864.1 hypothetical protein N7445_008596 [Penicillium cf. griseofulvum]